MNCQHCQPLLLDHLYGLLDGPEAATVDAHLASCPACAAAHAETARVQGLIARAAKSAFPGTRFEAPASPATTGTRTPAPASPATLPFPAAAPGAKPARTFRIGAVLPWAVAAAVLLAVPGTVIPVLGLFNRAAEANRAADSAKREADLLASAATGIEVARKSRLSDAEFKLAVAEQSQTALLNQWFQAQKVAVQTATTRKLTVDVLKPASVQPGAPNDFLVVVNDQRDQWERSGKRMVAEVHAVGASDAVIFTQALDSERAADKKHALRLPAVAWTKVKPDAELFLVVAQVDEKTQTRTELLERVRLAGPVFATLLVTDKAAYRPGERLFFRSLTLDRVTFRPPGRDQILRYELLHPDGRPVGGMSVAGTTELVRVGAEGKVEPVRSANGQPVRGVGCGEFVLPADLADGDYTLVLREHVHPGGFPATVPGPVVRPVKVRTGAADNYRKQVGFARASYAPGATVEAWAELAFQDKPVANATVLGIAATADGHAIDGVEVVKATNANGRADFKFALPDAIQNGDVQVTVTFRTPAGTEEVVARRVPVVGSRLVVEFFPECGDVLVAGVPCKVYVRATTPAGTPVDIRGVITDGRQTLAKVETLTDRNEPGANRGLASFTYTPELGTRVWLKLESPVGASAPILPQVAVPNATVALLGGAGAAATRTGFMLPMPKPDGVVMTVLDPVTAPGEPIRVRIHSVGQPRALVVGAYTRGRLSDTQKVTVDPELPQTVKLMAGADPRGGVVRVTVFEEVDEKGRGDESKAELKPVAERLVFRKPGEVLKLTCTVAPADAPGGAVPVAPVVAAPTFTANSAVKLGLTATDEKGNPAAAILWAAAVNTGVAPGPKDRLMPTHFLLAGEVKNPDDLEYADFLLTDHPKAAEALDLLLGTQGWRRFAEQQTAPTDGVRGQAVPVPHPELVRLKGQNGQFATWTEPPPLRDHRKLSETFGPRYEAAVQAVARAKAGLAATREKAQDPQPVLAATSAAEAAKRTAEEKTGRAESAREPVRQFRAGVWYGVAGLAALALCCGAVALARPTDRFPLGFSTLGSVGLAMFLILASGWGDDAKAATKDGTAKADRAPAPAEEKFAQKSVPAASLENFGAAAVEPMAPGMPDAAKADAPGDKGAKTDAAPPKGGIAGGTAPGGFGGPRPPAPKTPIYGSPGLPNPGLVRQPDPKPAPVAPSPPGGPGFAPPPGPLPPTMPAPGGGGPGGWNPHRANGAIQTDTNLGLAPMLKATAGAATGRTAGHADELKRVADQAAGYAADRANTLGAPLDAYFMQRMRAKKSGPEAAMGPGAEKPSADKFQSVERFVVQQIRGAVTPLPPLVVREYAAPRPTLTPLADDPPDTVLWQPVIVLPADGKTTLNFHLGAAPGGYQLMVAGHTADGRLGAVRGVILVTPPPTPAFPQIGPVGPDVPAGSIPPVVPVAPGPRPMP